VSVWRECRPVCPGHGEWATCEDYVEEGGWAGDPCNEAAFGECREEDYCCFWLVRCEGGVARESSGCTC
jgi:hypothetical protein